MRGKKHLHPTERQKAVAAAKQAYKARLARIARTYADREKALKRALKTFRPRKSERGKIIFLGVRGGRIPASANRRGYAVYVNRAGKKQVVRQLTRDRKHVEKIPTAKKLSSIDVSRVRSKRAKQQFLTAHLNPIASKELRRKTKKGKRGISSKGTRYAGTLQTDKFYENSDSVEIIAKELSRANNSQRSKRDFLITIGVAVREGKKGKLHWIELSRRFSRADKQEATEAECRAFLGREVYAFLARELSDRDLVLQGSARHIGRLKENRGNPRDEWTKDGFLWQGHDQKNVQIEKIEYRIDQLKIGK